VAPPFFASALDGGEPSASRTGRLNLWEKDPGIHCIGNLVGPRAGLNAVEKNVWPLPGSESQSSSP
jgi:hypothetical protein